MFKIFAIIISYVFAASVLFGVYNTIKKRCKKDKQKETKICCTGCKHLDYWNDGSGMCLINLDHVCPKTGFIFREPNNK